MMTNFNNKVYLKDINKCQCCNSEVEAFSMKYLRGIGDTKITRACEKCYEDYFEQVKSNYFVEEYKGNVIYSWNNFYFPYWEASYAFNTLDDCRNRIDNSTVAMVDMNAFHMLNKLQN